MNGLVLHIFYITGYWFGKGARIGSPLSQASWFLLEKMWKELRTDMVEMFLIKFDNFTLLRQNLCRECKACLLSLVTSPVWDPTSKGVTLALNTEISLVKCWYFSSFNLFDVEILVSFGTVSS